MTQPQVLRYTGWHDLQQLGLWWPHSNGTVIYVHGSLGNCYENLFIHRIAAALQTRRLGLLSINMAAHDGIAEAYTVNGAFEYVGGSIVPFESCLDDIAGAIELLHQNGDACVGLIGHSLGCDRVATYAMRRGPDTLPIALLSPADSFALQEVWINPETVGQQISRLTRMGLQDGDWLAREEYGVRNRGEDYFIPITWGSFRSICEGLPFTLFNVQEHPPASGKVQNPTWVYLGGSDPWQSSSAPEFEAALLRRFRRLTTFLCSDGGHSLENVEDRVTAELALWIAGRKGSDQ